MAGRREVDLRGPTSEAPAIGIDLGTTFSVVGVCRKGKVDMFANSTTNSRTMPSVVGFLDGEHFVGQAAKDLPAANQVFDAKRLIGRPWKDLNLQADRKHWPFEVVEEKGAPKIELNVDGMRESFAPEEISAMVLRALKETAEDALDAKVTKAVVTVPAYFNERQRQATNDAATIAGLEVIGMINEPTAAAIAYGLDKKKTGKKKVFIYDLGGGTFDVSIMTVDGPHFDVIGSGGDTHLGGQDFDMILMDHFIAEIRAKHGVDLDAQSRQDLRNACELVKRKLSNLNEAPMSVYFPRLNLGYKGSLTRAHFESLCQGLFKKTIDIASEVLQDAKLRPADIDDVVLVGGSTRIPKVQSLLRDLFNGKDLRHSINPDEAVAYGAAVHAAVLTGDKFVSNLVKLKDVTPLSLGVEVVGGRFSVVVPKNTPIPCKMSEKYTTVEDNQTLLRNKVFQGERPLTKDNYFLNKEFTIPVPPKPRGEVKIVTTFEIDANGLLKVSSVEPTTNVEKHVTISHDEAHLSEKDIQEMILKADRLRKQDLEDKERIEAELRRKLLIF